MDAPDQQLLDTIENHGWAVIRVSADADGPSFAYSIGLYQTFEHPEIIIVASDCALMRPLPTRRTPSRRSWAG